MKNSENNDFSRKEKQNIFRAGAGFIASLFRNDPLIFLDESHMQKREKGSRMHFIYCLLFLLSSASSLWQHSTPAFTFTALLLILPLSFVLFLPYKAADTLTRQMLSCGFFFAACFWICFRLQKQIPYDLALVEGLVLGAMAFLMNNTRKDYHYLFLISLFLLIYSGLVPRKLLLYLAPAAALSIFLLLFGDRLTFLAGERSIKTSPQNSALRSLYRSWHIKLFQLLLAFFLFLFIFSLLPLHDTGSEGFFEVSFMTERTSILPPDIRKWLGQDKKFKITKEGQMPLEAGDQATSNSHSGKKTRSANLPGTADGDGQGSSPGKELLFTCSMPVKLYHLATLYDVYDGKKWHTSDLLKKNPVRDYNILYSLYTFTINSKYTVFKWVSGNLFAPFRPSDYQFDIREASPSISASYVKQWGKYFRALRQTPFNAKFDSMENLPPLPFRYNVSSQLLIPLVPENEEKKTEEKAEEKTGNKNTKKLLKIHDSAESFLTREAEKEKAKRAEALAKYQQTKAKQDLKKAQKKKAPVQKKVSPPVEERPVILRYGPNGNHYPRVVRSGEKPQRPKVLESDFSFYKRPKVLSYAPEIPKKPLYRFKKYSQDPSWLEKLPKKHFLQLPQNLSTRVTGLASIITKDLTASYDKAIALRDYLRNNYKYKLEASPVPEGQESIEYFLFELKEGHCEYFAAALTILARACGLPARVATGFSPGNYNALTKLFEVHEYHAHAWSQIHIENAGWLTFDAVPPGNINSETLPAGLGLLRDPFGDEWKITPPELTQATLGFVRNTLLKDYMRSKSENLQNTINKMLQNEEELKDKKTLKNKKVVKGSNKGGKAAKGGIRSGVLERMKSFLIYLTGKTGEKLIVFLSTFRGKIFSLALLIFLASLFFFFRDILSYGRLLFLRYRFSRLLLMAQEQKETAPEKSILYIYRAMRILLILAGMSRKNNHELLAYGEETAQFYLQAWQKKKGWKENGPEVLQRKSREFSHRVQKVFSGFYLLEYGESSFTAKEVIEYHVYIKTVFTQLRELYPDGLFFLEKLIFISPFPDETPEKES